MPWRGDAAAHPVFPRRRSNPLIDAFINAVRAVSRLCGVIAALLIAAAILVVCQMVVIRYFLGWSAIWQTDFVIFALVGATLIGSPYVLLLRGHVCVDLLPLWLGPRGRLGLALFSSAAALLFCVALGWTGWELFHEALTEGWRTQTVWSLPLWIPYLSLPVGIGLLCLQYVCDIVALLTGRAAPFAAPADELERAAGHRRPEASR